MGVKRDLLVDLPIFLEVARHGNMTKAAAALHTVQSNVTARIQRLEDQLGATLLIRGARSLHLTPEGEALLPFALRLEELGRDLQRHFGPGHHPETGSLRLGSIETFAASHLAGLIAAFGAAHPSVDISVQTGGTAVLQEKILNSELDAAFVSRRANEPSLVEEMIFSDELVVIAPAGLAALEDLARQPRLRILVQRVGCSFTGRLLDWLASAGIPHGPVRAVGTLEGVVSNVRAGSGVAVLPRSYLSSLSGLRRLSFLPMPEDLRAVDIYLIAQRWKRPIRLLEAFRRSCSSTRKRRPVSSKAPPAVRKPATEKPAARNKSPGKG